MNSQISLSPHKSHLKTARYSVTGTNRKDIVSPHMVLYTNMYLRYDLGGKISGNLGVVPVDFSE